jgi:hypothetical protein
MKLDLEKSADSLRLSLEKGGVTAPTAELAFNLDVSGSFEGLHLDGATTLLLARLVPWGMVFDPDKKLDIFTFSDGKDHACYAGEITPQNYEGFVCREIVNRVPGWNGGTDYSYVLEKTLQHFGWLAGSAGSAPAVVKPPKVGFMKRWFGGGVPSEQAGSGPQPESVGKKRSICIFITDGEANGTDKSRTRQILSQSEKRGDLVYFLFLGINKNSGEKFAFLQEIADAYGNTGLTIVRDLQVFTEMTDEELNAELIGDELLEWLKK